MLRRVLVRKLVVNILATVVVLMVAGAALAGTSVMSELAGDPETAGDPHPVPAVTERESVESEVETLVLEDETGTAEENFGQIRSAEVRQFGECMSAAASHAERDACHELKPGPAWQTDGHPGKGPEQPDAPHAEEAKGQGKAKSSDARGNGQGNGKPEDAGAASDDEGGDSDAVGSPDSLDSHDADDSVAGKGKGKGNGNGAPASKGGKSGRGGGRS